MRILTIDVGTGTQDILLFDSSQTLENCVKMILPSPTAIAAQRIREATTRRNTLVLTGFNMGGGPCSWALEDHLKAGLTAYSTPQAARTFNDDLSEVEAMGVRLISDSEAARVDGAVRVRLVDLDIAAIRTALDSFGVSTNFDGIAVAVLDHGEAPPGVSDRIFRFEHIRRVITEKQSLLGFAYLADELPAYLTRMRDLAQQVEEPLPMLLLDTGPAAALGAMEDPLVSQQEQVIVVNTGNMHAMAVHIHGGELAGIFEHHTGALSPEQLNAYLRQLADGSLTHEDIFNSHGHGCVIVRQVASSARPFLAITGPRRGRFANMEWRPYFAVPHGDMMIAGCFGLLRGFAARQPDWREEIEKALGIDN